MSYPNPPEQPPPYRSGPSAAPSYGPPPRPAHLRGRRPLQIGIPLLVIGLALIVVGVIVIATKSVSKVDAFDRVSFASGTGNASFSKAGGYVAYYEAPGLDVEHDDPPLVAARLTSPSGKSMVLDKHDLYGGGTHTIKKLTYAYKGHDGAALFQFHIAEPGTYRVELRSSGRLPAGADMAFGESIAAGTVAGGLLIVVGLLLLLAGVVLVIVGLVKRSRHKKEIENSPFRDPGYGPPPASAYGPPPGSGYGPPPGSGYRPPPAPGYGPPPGSGNPPPGATNPPPGFGNPPTGGQSAD